MKKLSLLALGLLLATVASVSFAERRTLQVPVTQDGKPAHPYFSGARYYRQTNTAENNPVDGPVVIMGIILYMDSAPTTRTFVRLRDTDTGSDATVNTVLQLSFSSDTGINQLPFPIRLDSGFAVDLSAASNGETATVLYLDVSD